MKFLLLLLLSLLTFTYVTSHGITLPQTQPIPTHVVLPKNVQIRPTPKIETIKMHQVPLTVPHQQAPTPTQQQQQINPTVQIPVYIPVQRLQDALITNVTVQMPAPQITVQPQLPTVVNTSINITPIQPQPQPQPVPVVGPPAPTPTPAPAPAPVVIPITPRQPIMTGQPSPSTPTTTHTLLQHIHATPELGMFSLWLSLPFNNRTQAILNQTNVDGINSQITVFGPSNVGVLRFMRKMILLLSIKAVLPKENTTCDESLVHDLQRLQQAKVAYLNIVAFTNAFNNVTANSTQLQQLLAGLTPVYQQMVANFTLTEEEKHKMSANGLYHIANQSINIDQVPSLSFYPSLMNDTQFVLLNSPHTQIPIQSQRIQIVKQEKYGKQQTALLFGVPGSSYYKARVYEESKYRNIQATNGLLHIIDRIQYIPTNITWTAMIADAFSALSVLNSTGLLPRLDLTPNITVFMPSDEAIAMTQQYKQMMNQTELQQQVLRHIVTGVHYTTDLFSSPTLLNYNNETTSVRAINNETFIIEGATIVIPNILFKNGVIHIIDRALISPSLLASSPHVQARMMSPHYPSQPFPMTPPFQFTSPTHVQQQQQQSNITCPLGDRICYIVNPVTNQTSIYPTCYNPTTHICVNNAFLCPITSPYACGVHCYNINTHECKTIYVAGALHYHLTKRIVPLTTTTTTTPPPHHMIRTTAPTPKCGITDQLCNVIDIRNSTTHSIPTCYHPSTHVCSNSTFLCPVTHPSLCGAACYHTTFYTCSYTFQNNSYQWILTPTQTLIELEKNKTIPATIPAPTQPPTQPPAKPTTPPRPVAPTTTVTCPQGDQVCQVRSPSAASSPALAIPTCFSPSTHVCANSTFLCPISAPLLCSIYCYSSTTFICQNNTLVLKHITTQPKLAPRVAASLKPKPLFVPTYRVVTPQQQQQGQQQVRLDIATSTGQVTPSTKMMTSLPSHLELQHTIQATAPRITASYPRQVSIELPSLRTNPAGLVVTRTTNLPAGARIAMVGEADLASLADVIASLPPAQRARLTQAAAHNN